MHAAACHFLLGAGLSFGLALPCPAQAGGEADLLARVVSFDLVDNGGFEQVHEGGDSSLAGRLAWWRTPGVEGARAVREQGGSSWLMLSKGSYASQPIAAYAPLAGGLRIRGRVRGEGILALRDGSGAVATFELGQPGEPREDAQPAESYDAFELSGSDVAERLGHDPLPRLELFLACAGDEPVRWTDIQVWVPLPCPDAQTLRRDIAARMELVFDAWLDLGRVQGEPFIYHVFDVVTGDLAQDGTGRPVELEAGIFPVFTLLLEALAVHPSERWQEAFDEYFEGYLELGIHPQSGLPQKWNRTKQRGASEKFSEIAPDLAFLIDVAEAGPERFRAAARAAALAMGEAVLAHGVQPDANVAAAYRPLDGAVSLSNPPLRRLDVPAQLARLSALADDERFLVAARNALAAFEFTHHWPGSWQRIDPGFDDDFGHYAARAVTMLEARPGERAFAGVVDGGWLHFRSLWRDALRHGGTIAADQVRCWRILADRAQQRPELRGALGPLLSDALRAHFKSQQYKNGAFGDVTFVDFDPKTGIQVGDLPGTPANLFQGLALCYGRGLDLGDERLRAMLATLLLTTDEHYRRPHGYLLGERELSGFNPAGGGIRLCPGFIELLGKL